MGWWGEGRWNDIHHDHGDCVGVYKKGGRPLDGLVMSKDPAAVKLIQTLAAQFPDLIVAASIVTMATPKTAKAALELFELSTLTPMERVENATGLTNFRNAHGSYPSRYRALIWRFLLQLPENHNAYEKVSTKPVHFAYADLRERYPLQDDTVFNRLQRLCSNLAHWDSMFCEAGVVNYLPQMCFPFVVLYGADEISALETMISIFMYWGFGWYSTYPAEPTHIYKATSNLLERHDKMDKMIKMIVPMSTGQVEPHIAGRFGIKRA